MDCNRLDQLLVDYLYGELPAQQVAEVEAKLADCPHCASKLADLQDTRQLMQQLEPLPAPTASLSFLLEEAATAARQRTNLWTRLAAALRSLVFNPAPAAAMILVLALGVSFFVYQRGSLKQESAMRAPLPAGSTATRPELESSAGDTKGSLDQQPQREVASQAAQGEALRKEEAQARQQPQPNPTNAGYLRAGVDRKADKDNADAPAAAVSNTNSALRGGLDDLTTGNKQTSGNGGRISYKAKRAARVASRKKSTEQAPKQTRPARSSFAQPSRKPNAPVDEVQTILSKEGIDPLRRYLMAGDAAVRSNRCYMAFDYYSRAIKQNPSLARQIRTSLGGCLTALQYPKNRSRYRLLASQVEAAQRTDDGRYSKARRQRLADQAEGAEQKAIAAPVKKKAAPAKRSAPSAPASTDSKHAY